MKPIFWVMALLSLCVLPTDAGVKVATLHPIIADLVRQVGGANVEVVEILKPGGDVHHFEPTAKDIAAMRGAKLIMASGKNLESYLDKLRDSVGAGVEVVELEGVADAGTNPPASLALVLLSTAKG
jgi:zinc/manganese transport system substrate-binding protein